LLFSSEELDKKYKSFNVEYKKRDALIREQKKLIDERNKCIKSLEERIKTLEKRYENEAISRDNLIKQFKSQVDAQSSQIANLTFQIHQLTKSKLSSSISNVDLSALNLGSTFDQQQKQPHSATRSRKIRKESFLTNDLNSSAISHSAQVNANERVSNDHHLMNAAHNYTISNNNNASSNSVIKTQNQASAFELNYLVSASHNTFMYEKPASNNEHDESFQQYQQQRSSSRSSSARSDRSQTKSALPPPSFNKADSVPPPDPKPFLLQSSASTLHSRSKKELIQRRTLISLPPIKPYEINQLAVESPLKSGIPKANEKNNATN
jgi:hypothetical protein